jgi:hypothetical protein
MKRNQLARRRGHPPIGNGIAAREVNQARRAIEQNEERPTL